MNRKDPWFIPAQENPWYSPPALQYVARLNPPARHSAQVGSFRPAQVGSFHGLGYASNPWRRIRGHLEEAECAYCGYPLYVGDKVYEDEEGEVYCCVACAKKHGSMKGGENPYSFSDPEPNPWHPGGGIRIDGEYHPGSGRFHTHRGSHYHYGGGRRYGGAYYPGGGYYPQANPYGHNPSDDYGNWYAALNPYGRPMPGQWHPSFADEEEEERDERIRSSMEALGAYNLNPSDDYGNWYAALNPGCREKSLGFGKGYSLECYYTNPYLGGGGHSPLRIHGHSVPTTFSKKGRYHHVRFADPEEFDTIRTGTLSEEKGLKARYGITYDPSEYGPRGGRTELQSLLFDASRYTPEDVGRWIEGHKVPEPLIVDIAPKKATSRRLKLYGKEESKKRKPKKRKRAKKEVVKRKVAANKGKKKKSSRSVPPKGKRCSAKTSKGQCRGWRMEGSSQCSLHAQSLVRSSKKKSSAKKKRRAG